MIAARATIAAGLLLALAATLAPTLPAPGAPGASLVVRLPGPVQIAVLTLLALSALLLILLQRPWRPREDGLPHARARRRPPAWAALLSLLPFLALLGGAWYVATYRAAGSDINPIERAITAIAGLVDLLALARKPPMSMPFLDATIAALVLALALGVFALLLLVTLAPRLERWLGGRAAAEPLASPAGRAAEPGDPRAESDPRRAIELAWRRFERALERAGVPRAPWQTPAEVMRSTLTRGLVPAAPVARLTALFELARFSDRPLGPEARADACDSVEALAAALEAEDARAR